MTLLASPKAKQTALPGLIRKKLIMHYDTFPSFPFCASPSGNGTLQGGLQLTPHQASKVLTARRCLLEKLRKVGQERRQLLSTLGLQLLQTPQDRWAQSVPVQRLQNNLGQERAAASAFLFSTIDEVKARTQSLCVV